ncbi:hypothetical protein TNCV_2217481 [Trichonephila clavipes]|nr:hypothetical protein TNCV_2217481 [Trichonephila clavipes]
MKNVKSEKGPLTPAGLLKLVKRFEETGKLEDRARAGRPCLKEARSPCIAVEMEAIASEAASGTSSAREAAKRLGLPPSSARNILRRILQLYPYNCNRAMNFCQQIPHEPRGLVKNSWPKCHGFEFRCLLKHGMYRDPVHISSVEAQCPPVGVVVRRRRCQFRCRPRHLTEAQNVEARHQ